MKHARIVLALSLAFSMPLAANASTLQIDDETDNVTLNIDGQPITGNGGNISGYSNGIYAGVDRNGNAYDIEKLTFNFTSGSIWNADTKNYVTMTGRTEDAGHLLSDIFFVSGTAQSNVDSISFYSMDIFGVNSYGNFVSWLQTILDPADPNYAAVFFDTNGFSSAGSVSESDQFQTLYTTVSDVYQARSDAPEPGTLALLSLAGILAARRRKSSL